MSGLGARDSGLGARGSRLGPRRLGPETRAPEPRAPSPEPRAPSAPAILPSEIRGPEPAGGAGTGFRARLRAAAHRSRRGVLSRPGVGGVRPGSAMQNVAVAVERRLTGAVPGVCLRPEAKASSPRWKAGISVCSLSSFRSRCRERPCHRRTAPRQRPGHPRGPPLSQRAGAPERLAALGHPAALARDAPILRQGRRRRDRQPRRGHVGLRLRAARRARRAAAEPFPLSRFADRRRDGSGLQARVGRRDLWRHRDPVPAVQHALSALRRVPADAAG